MNKCWHLFKGEVLRLFRYKIIFFGLLVSLIWVVIIALSDKTSAVALAPSLVLMDAGAMSIILLGSSFFLEKQEGTLHALLVAPVSLKTVLLARILSALFTALVSFVIVIGSLMIFHGVSIPVLTLLFYTLLVVLAHTAIGYILTLNAKDFMNLLVVYMGIIILFMSPILLVTLEVIPNQLEFLTLLSPSYSGQILFQSVFKDVESWKIWFSIVYLILIPLILYPLVVYKKFKKVAIEG